MIETGYKLWAMSYGAVVRQHATVAQRARMLNRKMQDEVQKAR